MASSQSSSWGCLSLLGLVLLALWLLNPLPDSHLQAVRVELQRRCDQAISEEDLITGTLHWFTKDATVDVIVQRVEYHNYLLASTTTYEGRQMTFGIGGRVFVTIEAKPLVEG